MQDWYSWNPDIMKQKTIDISSANFWYIKIISWFSTVKQLGRKPANN